jgi:hypothetical protein
MLSGEQADPETEAEQLEKKTRALQAQHEYATTADMLNNPESVQKMREARQNELVAKADAAEKEAKEAAERERQRLADDKATAEQAAAAEQQKREAAEKALQDQRDKMLLDKLDELKNSQKPIAQQLTEYLGFFDTLNEKLGLPKFGTKPPDTTTHTDPHITLELEKIRIEEAGRQREHEWKMQKDNQAWQLTLMQFQRDGVFKEKELALQEKRDSQLFSIPEVIGGAIARGLTDKGAAGAGGIATAPINQAYQVNMEEGQTGTIDCPNCKAQVGIGPTQDQTQCVKCGAPFMVVRRPKGQPPTQPPASQEIKYEPEDLGK